MEQRLEQGRHHQVDQHQRQHQVEQHLLLGLIGFLEPGAERPRVADREAHPVHLARDALPHLARLLGVAVAAHRQDRAPLLALDAGRRAHGAELGHRAERDRALARDRDRELIELGEARAVALGEPRLHLHLAVRAAEARQRTATEELGHRPADACGGESVAERAIAVHHHLDLLLPALAPHQHVGHAGHTCQPPLHLLGQHVETRPRVAEQAHRDARGARVLVASAQPQLQARQLGQAPAQLLAQRFRPLVVLEAGGEIAAGHRAVVGEVRVRALDVQRVLARLEPRLDARHVLLHLGVVQIVGELVLHHDRLDLGGGERALVHRHEGQDRDHEHPHRDPGGGRAVGERPAQHPLVEGRDAPEQRRLPHPAFSTRPSRAGWR